MDSNRKLMTPEELRNELLNINISFCNYIDTFKQDFKESPEHLNNAMKYSNQLTEGFTKFYEQFN